MTEQDARAEDIVSRYSTYAAAAGLIPLPIVDLAAVTGLQIKMASEIARVYDVPFANERATTIIGSLVGGAASTGLGYSVAHSALKTQRDRFKGSGGSRGQRVLVQGFNGSRAQVRFWFSTRTS